MTQESPSEAPRIVVNQTEQPCGCVLTEYNDGKVLAPCIPCGLNAAAGAAAQAGNQLMQLANALGAIAATARKRRMGLVP
jgi:hypothetical protein